MFPLSSLTSTLSPSMSSPYSLPALLTAYLWRAIDALLAYTMLAILSALSLSNLYSERTTSDHAARLT